MFPNSSLFRSRWMALIWAGGMVLFAVNVAGTGSMNPEADAAADADGRAAINAFEAIN